MVSAYSDIQKGSTERNTIPISEIYAYYKMFRAEIPDSKHEFVYLIHQMNQVLVDMVAEQLDKSKHRKK